LYCKYDGGIFVSFSGVTSRLSASHIAFKTSCIRIISAPYVINFYSVDPI